MRQIQRTLWLAIIAGCVARTAAVAGTIEPGLERLLADRNEARVIVLLHEPPANDSGEAAYRRALEESQRDFLQFLAGRAKTGTVRSYWLAAAVALIADRALVYELARRPEVERVVRDAVVRLPSTRAAPSPMEGDTAEATYGLLKLGAPLVWKQGFTGKGVRVGIIDTGVDAGHPDLAGKIAGWKDFVQGRASPYDDHGHGTHCAGTVAGVRAGGRAIGVAPGATLLVAKVFDQTGQTELSKLLDAMQWMAASPTRPAARGWKAR